MNPAPEFITGYKAGQDLTVGLHEFQGIVAD
jgi:hypothetical protein